MFELRMCEMSLFEAPEKYYLAHCISADFALGKGIAAEFSKRFNTRQRLRQEHPNYCDWFIRQRMLGDCLVVDRTINLVTKIHCYDKPTLISLSSALMRCKSLCLEFGIQYIAMPKIGCGLDRLKWDDVKPLISQIFADTDIKIIVCVPADSGKRVYRVRYCESSVLIVDIEANSSEEAISEFERRNDRGEIDFSYADVTDSSVTASEL